MNKDVIYYPREKILQAAQRFETPFFIYEERRLRENCRRFRAAFERHFPDFWPLFAVKANPNPEILKIVASEGFEMDASSESEAWLCGKLGIGGMYTGNYTPATTLKFAKEQGFILNLDDLSNIPMLEEIGIPEILSFRINPGVGKSTLKSGVFAGPDAKYGVPFERAAEAYRQAAAFGVKRFGIHMMTGTNVPIGEGAYFADIVRRLFSVVADVKAKTGIEIECLNMGGGFGVPYRPEEKSLNIEEVAASVRRAFDEECKNHGLKKPRLMAEPGRWISADAGWLVGRITVIKDSYKKFVGIDASASDMPRPSIYDAYHYVSVLPRNEAPAKVPSATLSGNFDPHVQASTLRSKFPCRLASDTFAEASNDSITGDESETVNVVGSICENNDQFARDRELPKCEVGDLVVIHNCGAHAFSMGHNYNGKLRHAEYLIAERGELRQIRRAETIEDLHKTVKLGILAGKATLKIEADFKMTDEEFLQS